MSPVGIRPVTPVQVRRLPEPEVLSGHRLFVDIDAETLRTELVAMVRDEIGAVATFRDVTVVPALPKTRSGKILRKTMRQIADHEEYTVPSTIEDPDVLTALAAQLEG